MLHDLQSTLLAWFRANQRDLPWRAGYDPYHVWISEMMLQQTQMDRAASYFTRWTDRLPSIGDVAAASEETVLRLWEGLGYYSRARNVHKAAKAMVAGHDGRVPETREGLLALPGVGPYTAGAILSLAFGHPEPIVDANVERVYARLFDIDTPVKEAGARQRLWELARDLVPPEHPRDYNQAVMELGALICRKRPDCAACPVADHCEALRLGITAERPVPGKKADLTHLDIVCAVFAHQGRAFLQKRLPEGAWAGLWEFPGGRIEPGETPEAAAARELWEETRFRTASTEPVTIIKHGYTTYRVTLHCYLCAPEGDPGKPKLTAATDWTWADAATLRRLPLPAAHRKLADLVLKRGLVD